MTLRPIIPGTGLSEDEVIGAEDLSQGAGSDTVHGAGLEIHEDCAGNVASTSGLVEVDIDALQLDVGGGSVALEVAGGINAVLAADDLPELGSDLVPALAALDVEDFSHIFFLLGLGGFEIEIKREDE